MLNHHLHIQIFHLFQTLEPFFNTWGYLIIFATSFLEGLPIVGFFSPGTAALILGGILARTGALSFDKILILAAFGAFLGDLLSYTIGEIYGQHFFKKYGQFFFLKEAHLEKTQKLLQNHPGKTIIIGRFHMLTRSLAPFVAGISKIAFRRFVFYGAISSIVWTLTNATIGYLVGQGFISAARYINIILFSAFILSVLIFYGYRFVNQRRHIFVKYHLHVLILNISSLFIFAEILEDINAHKWLYQLDIWIHHFIPTIWNQGLILLMIIITNLFSPLNFFLFSCLFIGYLLAKKKYYYALLSVLSMIFGVLSEYTLKIVTGLSRPSDGILSVSGHSFPSGHATMAAIFAILIYHSLRKDLKTERQKTLLLIGSILLILLVGFSRIYLGLHWFSDVLAGYALGIFIITFFILFLRWGKFIWHEIFKIIKAFFSPIAPLHSNPDQSDNMN